MDAEILSDPCLLISFILLHPCAVLVFIFNQQFSDLFAPAEYHEEKNIGINSNSTIAKDLSAVWHDIDQHSVCVRLREGSRCPHPSLVGRLSGPMLAMLEWSELLSHDNSKTTVYCGSYKNSWLLPGVYFLEVIIIHCNGFGVTAFKQNNNNETMLKFDFVHECLEDPDNNHVTDTSAFISIRKEIYGIGVSSKGHWVSEVALPLHTRYQPQECREEKLAEKCRVAMNNTHFKALSFDFRDKELLEKKIAPFQIELSHLIPVSSTREDDSLTAVAVGNAVTYLEKTVHGFARHRNGKGMGNVDVNTRLEEFNGPKVCVVGWSHSYHLVHAFWQNSLGHQFIWASALWPTELTTTFFEKYHNERNCTKFVVSVAQWPASVQAWKPYHGPWTFEKWLNEMSRIAQIFKDTDINIQLYFRSIHRLPIGDSIGRCGNDQRPEDWRSPTVMDAYNYLVEKVASDSNDTRIHYIDTRFITDPLWDTAYDWNHVALRVSQVETLYIASEVLGP